MEVPVGDGAFMSIVNPRSFEDGGPEWVCRYGNVESIRYKLAALIESYDYFLSGEISMKEATRRLRLMRAARRAALEPPHDQ
jgi:hypothetical protein